jgi:hypothetical protein
MNGGRFQGIRNGSVGSVRDLIIGVVLGVTVAIIVGA